MTAPTTRHTIGARLGRAIPSGTLAAMASFLPPRAMGPLDAASDGLNIHPSEFGQSTNHLPANEGPFPLTPDIANDSR